MARHKVKLSFIINNAARKATYKKRKQGLLKKMLEITTLCGVEGCIVIYSPYEAQPVAWPSPEEAKRILTEFKELPKMSQFKKMYNQESYLRERLKKREIKIDKIQRLNREMEIEDVVGQLLVGKGNWSVLKPIDTSDIVYVIEKKETEFSKRIQFLEKNIQDGVRSSVTCNVGQGNPAVGSGFNQTTMVQSGAVNFAGNVGQGNPAMGSGFNQTAIVQSGDMDFAGNVGQGNPTVGIGFNQTAMVQSGEVNFARNVGQGNLVVEPGFNQIAMMQFGDVNFSSNSGQGNLTMGFGFNQTAMAQTETMNLTGNFGQQNPMVGLRSEDEVSFTELMKMADGFLLDATKSRSGSTTSTNVARQ